MLGLLIIAAIASGAAEPSAVITEESAQPAAASRAVAPPTDAAPKPVLSYLVRKEPAIKRNSIIRVRYEQGALSILAEGRALGSGEIGERILVMNASSHKTFTAYVSGINEAVVK